eukprot:EC688896.1.p2 GENE.EC688896.1~~EC688896.1.p2  ORF type:complete len:77 (-),score=1.45 EC688896.1:160-390(-)
MLVPLVARKGWQDKHRAWKDHPHCHKNRGGGSVLDPLPSSDSCGGGQYPLARKPQGQDETCSLAAAANRKVEWWWW